MGQEIESERFAPGDFDQFATRLRRETELLAAWFQHDRFSPEGGVAGFELEVWLVDAQGRPAPVNQRFLEVLDNPLVVPELSVFNVELNTPPLRLHGNVFAGMRQRLESLWRTCAHHAASLDVEMAMIGILPTVQESDLTLANMSRMVRYRALNEQVLRMRKGRPIPLEIDGMESLRSVHRDVMVEAATTSFQLHLQVKLDDAMRYFNAALLLSAPLVAATANSPYLFGRDLWDETRIPLFEQAVAVSGSEQEAGPEYRRVTFGSGYVRESLFELFRENLEQYPPLLPAWTEDAPETLSHLRLHNGTIWRWNRPLIGYDDQGTPHLRIEHRVIPAGPSIPDTIANAALFYGLIETLGRTQGYSRPSFSQCRNNFYAAARDGLQADVVWMNGNRTSLAQLLEAELLPMARCGLESLGVDADDIEAYLGIIEARVSAGRTGAHWQRMFVAKHGRDMQSLVAAYQERLSSGRPVHEWTFEF